MVDLARRLKTLPRGLAPRRSWYDVGSMKVCMLLGNVPAPGGGGLEGQVYDLSMGLLERGVDVQVVCSDRLHMPAPHSTLSDRTVTIPFEQTKLEMENPYISNLRLSRELSDAVDWHEYDLVHMHNHYGYYTTMRLRTSQRPVPALVTTFHLTPIGVMWRMLELGLPEEPDSRTDESVAMMEAAVANLSDHCIAVSNVVREDLVQRYHAPKDRVTTVYNGIDPGVFRPVPRAQARRELGLNPSGSYLLYIGPFDRFKGFLLLDSLEHLHPDIEVLVVWPSLDPEVKARAGDRLRHIGYVPRERLATVYSACELLAFPPVYAGFGLTLVEATACGCVPVVFDQSAVNEVVSDECAWMAPEVSPEAYAATINQAMRSPLTERKARAGIGAAGEYFTEERMLSQTLEVYERALAGRHGRVLELPLALGNR